MTAEQKQIHIAIGTKAQFIKMAPIMRHLHARNIDFNLIDLGQHALITENLRKDFAIKDPDVRLSVGENVSTITRGLRWVWKLFVMGFDSSKVRRDIFFDRGGVCLIHGDTASTMLALYLSRRAGLKVAHVEAGLRSFNILEPFPEEIVRLIAMRFCDYLFAPSRWAFDNLVKMNYGRKAFLLCANTSLEAARYSFSKNESAGISVKKYALVTVHRLENIFSRRKLTEIVFFIEEISRRMPVVFVQHPPTLHRLNQYGLEKRLQAIPNIVFSKIVSHAHFIGLVGACEFIVTDGGSIQEEAYYLNKPCLLLRRKTERMEGVGENVYLSNIDRANLTYFLDNYPQYRRKTDISDLRPSAQLVDKLLPLVG